MSFLFDMDSVTELPEEYSGSKSCSTGTIAEVLLAAKATELGFSVFFPIGHAQKADLVLWMSPQRPITVQVKSATFQKDYGVSWKFMVGSGKPSCARNPVDKSLNYTPYKRGDFDVLCAYIPERNSFVFYKLEDIIGLSSKRWNPDSCDENNWHILTT